jgi:uncharacterized protein (TIGR00290 family)
MSARKVWVAWSSGKDSAWALATLRADPAFEVVGLLTTVDESSARIPMHGVREELLLLQARAVGLAVHRVPIPNPCPNAVYEVRMRAALDAAKESGVEAIAFGDLFLEDVRAYRERAMSGTGIEPVFPLWGRPTAELAREMLAGGARAIVTCVDTRQCSADIVGRAWDARLLADLPATVDPCAEHGEFHTFAVGGPAFTWPLDVTVGERSESGGFVRVDLGVSGGERVG